MFFAIFLLTYFTFFFTWLFSISLCFTPFYCALFCFLSSVFYVLLSSTLPLFTQCSVLCSILFHCSVFSSTFICSFSSLFCTVFESAASVLLCYMCDFLLCCLFKVVEIFRNTHNTLRFYASYVFRSHPKPDVSQDEQLWNIKTKSFFVRISEQIQCFTKRRSMFYQETIKVLVGIYNLLKINNFESGNLVTTSSLTNKNREQTVIIFSVVIIYCNFRALVINNSAINFLSISTVSQLAVII